ncbi:uncharacterized protein LOC107815993 isoform X2 [Nicotiana tabacum]|uniref:Uncharacterized protein LOC107815993 isoform X2 n=1 Tax=Nicotiana tabacum TaxID=4097 RepID=A0AC58UNF0_TOBAC
MWPATAPACHSPRRSSSQIPGFKIAAEIIILFHFLVFIGKTFCLPGKIRINLKEQSQLKALNLKDSRHSEVDLRDKGIAS